MVLYVSGGVIALCGFPAVHTRDVMVNLGIRQDLNKNRAGRPVFFVKFL